MTLKNFGRFPIKSLGKFLFKFGVPLFFSLGCNSMVQWWVVEHNNRAAVHLKEERWSEGASRLLEALQADAIHPEVHFNLGYSFDRSSDLERAFQEYQATEPLAANNEELRYYTLFNQARILGEQKKISQALEFYQKALAINPHSREVKTNIELLVAKKGEGEGQGEGGGGGAKNPERDQDSPIENPQNQPQKAPEKLSREDIRKIQKELSEQEQKIRAKQNENNKQERIGGKDW